MMIIQIVLFGSLILFLIFTMVFTLRKYRFKKQIYKFYKPSNYPRKQRKLAYQQYKEALLEFNRLYTYYYDYLSNNHKKIFKCKYLMKDKIAKALYTDYIYELSYYEDTNIREEAVEKIKQCIKKIYVIDSAIDYYLYHLENANNTIVLLQQQRSSLFYQLYYPLVVKRINYLNNIVIQCNNIVDYLEIKRNELYDVVKKLEKIKKPTLLGAVFNVVTAPIRHLFNIADSILTGNDEKFLKSASLLGLSFLGVGVIADAIDVLDIVDSLDIDSMQLPEVSLDDPGLHHVDPHYVDGYTRADGTVVNGYIRGGEEGYLRSNPDSSIFNNLGSRR